jgi:uncharacterized protein (UPF0335 family)
MKRATAEEIVEYIREEISNLYHEGYEDAAFSGVYDNRWIDHVIKMAKRDERELLNSIMSNES